MAPSMRERILWGTALALRTNGLRKTTVQHILSQAGVSRRTYYQHFKSRDAAVLDLYQQVADALARAVVSGAATATDPVARIHAGIDAYLDFQLGGGDLLILVQAEAAHPDSLLAPYRERTLDHLSAFLDAEMQASTKVVLDPLVFRSLLLAMNGLVIYLQQKGSFTAADRDRIAGLMKPMFLNVLTGAAAGGKTPN